MEPFRLAVVGIFWSMQLLIKNWLFLRKNMYNSANIYRSSLFITPYRFLIDKRDNVSCTSAHLIRSKKMYRLKNENEGRVCHLGMSSRSILILYAIISLILPKALFILKKITDFKHTSSSIFDTIVNIWEIIMQ